MPLYSIGGLNVYGEDWNAASATYKSLPEADKEVDPEIKIEVSFVPRGQKYTAANGGRETAWHDLWQWSVLEPERYKGRSRDEIAQGCTHRYFDRKGRRALRKARKSATRSEQRFTESYVPVADHKALMVRIARLEKDMEVGEHAEVAAA